MFKFVNTSNEVTIALTVFHNFGVKHCIYIRNTIHKEINDILDLKKFYGQNVLATTINHDQLFEYLKIGSFSDVNTIIIMKEKNLANIIKLLENLETVKIISFINFMRSKHSFFQILFLIFSST